MSPEPWCPRSPKPPHQQPRPSPESTRGRGQGLGAAITKVASVPQGLETWRKVGGAWSWGGSCSHDPCEFPPVGLKRSCLRGVLFSSPRTWLAGSWLYRYGATATIFHCPLHLNPRPGAAHCPQLCRKPGKGYAFLGHCYSLKQGSQLRTTHPSILHFLKTLSLAGLGWVDPVCCPCTGIWGFSEKWLCEIRFSSEWVTSSVDDFECCCFAKAGTR